MKRRHFLQALAMSGAVSVVAPRLLDGQGGERARLRAVPAHVPVVVHAFILPLSATAEVPVRTV